MELEAAIRRRRSARKFKNMPVADAVIDQMLEMARLAPSGGNGQAHVFGVVKDEALKQALAHAAGGQMWIADAPVVIACCARLDEDPNALPEDDFGVAVNRLRWGDRFWAHLKSSPSWREAACLLANAAPLIPMEHMALTAAENGLSCCFVGWLDVAAASNILRLPDDIKCLFLLPVGYAAEPPAQKKLKSMAEISFYDTYQPNTGWCEAPDKG